MTVDEMCERSGQMAKAGSMLTGDDQHVMMVQSLLWELCAEVCSRLDDVKRQLAEVAGEG